MTNIISADPYILEEEHHYLLDRLAERNAVIFLTGKAGTGKSTLLKIFQKITDKKIVLLAPTGIAAVQIKGQTVHSFFRIPPNFHSRNEYHKLPKNFLEKIDMIVIDEISMLRADLLDHIDQILKLSMKSNLPFGNIPMLWIGDLFQLPPVVTREESVFFYSLYKSPYFFSSNVFKDLPNFEMIELQRVFRQKDPNFIKLLNKIRLGEIDVEDLEDLNRELYLKKESSIHQPASLRITITATNYIANAINQKQLQLIESKSLTYTADITGTVLANQYPNDQILNLKIGAQVIFIRNDPNKQFVNGTLGHIIDIQKDYAMIELELSGVSRIIEVKKMTWEIVKYQFNSAAKDIKSEVVGTFSQLPLKLGWAITIHKSQGQTFEKVNINLGSGAFEKGQSYVALSRCKSLEGIKLKSPIKLSDIQFDEEVVDFLRKFN